MAFEARKARKAQQEKWKTRMVLWIAFCYLILAAVRCSAPRTEYLASDWHIPDRTPVLLPETAEPQ